MTANQLLGVVAPLLLLFSSCWCLEENLPKYKLCVPHHIYDACKTLTGNPSNAARIECVPARDRMECLEKVNQREADFLAVDPEDMYVAFNMQNEDFSVFSEIRTREESDAPFRYEGIMLVHKNSNIHSLSDLKGKKSCHTGYGRNVGYKIPITKLKKHQLLKISTDAAIPFYEKELQGLTDLFSQSCLVGTWSPNEEVNRALKKRYSNLCALCEDPVKCDYPDKYSGYDGAIRCLAENGGDVAFTKVIFVKRHFGLSVGNNPPKTQAQGNPDDFEYLCEDGTRRPITGSSSCTWAQRPWQAYMGNADVNTKLTPLQQKINAFYTEGQQQSDKDLAAKMWINDANVVVDKEHQTLPGQHLELAQYKEVIERDGSTQQKIRLCVKNDMEMRKCDILKRVAFARDIRPEFDCVLSADCINSVHENRADAVVVPPQDFKTARAQKLKPIVYEELDDKNIYVAMISRETSDDMIAKSEMSYDTSNPRSLDCALILNKKRHIDRCPAAMHSSPDARIQIIRSNDLPKSDNQQLLCPDMTRKSINEFADCNFNEFLSGGAVFTRSDLRSAELEAMTHGFRALSDKFGHGSKTEEVFEVFGLFEAGATNAIFGDDTGKLVLQPNRLTETNEDLYSQMHCIGNRK